MNKKERAHIIEKHLNRLFPHPQIPLQHDDAFTLLIAVLLSAQCTDTRVNQITPKLFAKANTARKMAKLPIHLIEEIIRPCGLFKTKAKRIQELSKMLVAKYKERVPATLQALESLPGVGHKTASVVLAQAFHKPAFPVDTHIHRSAQRWGLTKAKTVEGTEKALKRLFLKKRWTILHLQIILYARSFCPARGHKLERCPICSEFASLPIKLLSANI